MYISGRFPRVQLSVRGVDCINDFKRRRDDSDYSCDIIMVVFVTNLQLLKSKKYLTKYFIMVKFDTRPYAVIAVNMPSSFLLNLSHRFKS